jgi:myosin V
MELNQHVWLRRNASHWGWVPAVIVRKEEVKVDGFDRINLTLVNDRNIEASMSGGSALVRSGSQYFADEEEFEEVVTVDPEQLKTADHADIKLRNLPSSYRFSGEDQEAQVLASPSSKVDSNIVGGVDDLIELTHLHEPAILHALRLRYDSDIIYTSTGPILIAINPFKHMDLYTDAMMDEYRLQGETTGSAPNAKSPSKFATPFKAGQKKQEVANRLAPHVYQTADGAYRQMLRGLENHVLMKTPKKSHNPLNAVQQASPANQSILVSGESGAGKTVTTKIVLNYFAMLSRRRAMEEQRSTPSKTPQRQRDGPTSEDICIEQQVLQSNPILESFGNARTIRNDNSSRFGKYIDISFTRNGKLSGASIETYLLEKVRLIHPSMGERNYHVFYQFLKSASAKERQDFHIGSKSFQDFRLLSESGTFTRRDGVDDEDNHYEMLDAMVSWTIS